MGGSPGKLLDLNANLMLSEGEERVVGWSHLRKVQLDHEEVLKPNQMSEYQGAPGHALLIDPAALSH